MVYLTDSPVHDIACALCHTPFQSKYPRALYCSPRCRVNAGSKRWRERNREHYLALHRERMRRAAERDRDAHNAAQRKRYAVWYRRHQTDHPDRNRRYLALLREQAIMAYGGWQCGCCGETQPEFLTLDHINGRELGDKRTGVKLYSYLRRRGWPPGFQVLCQNCNFAKGHHRTCPHRP